MTHIDSLDTPALVVDLDQLSINIRSLQDYLSEHGIANRPHIKTHKIPAIAQMQVDAGASGLTCQKIGEAEVMADAGFTDLFLPYNILGDAKLERLMALARRATLSVTTDSEVVARGLSRAAQQAGLTLTVLVECDLGHRRCGVQSPQAAAVLARLIDDLPGLRFGGLMTYPNTDRLDPFVGETRALLAQAGPPIERVSGGGTACMWQAHTHPELTEHRAGMYIFGDRHLLKSGAMTLDTIAFKIIATVVSRPTPDRGILDCGSKVLSSDLMGLEGHGYIREYPQAKIYALSEEHGHVDFSECDRKPEIGERVSVLPNHCCPAVNLADELVGVRRNQVEVVWPIVARGKVR
jgi:D-serine deaminase-like pyridoxal phosphate-dependent protein